MLTKSQIKYIQSLGHKKFRDETGLFIAEGPRIVNEWLQDPGISMEAIYALPEWIAAHPEAKAVEISETELQRISQLQQPNQVLAMVRQWNYSIPEGATDAWMLGLDQIQDPGNLGTIIRIADWFGVVHIICQPDTADIYNPKVVQASMGSLARVRVLYEELTTWIQKHPDTLVYGATLEGREITQLKNPKKGLLVIGNEARGIRPELMERVNVRLTIPRKGGAESLNAAVATGILLSHLN